MYRIYLFVRIMSGAGSAPSKVVFVDGIVLLLILGLNCIGSFLDTIQKKQK